MAEKEKQGALIEPQPVERAELEAFKAEVSDGMSRIMERLDQLAQVEAGRGRPSRAQEMSGQASVHESYADAWEDPSLLDNPALRARPGYAQMWIRTAIAGEADGSNVARMFNRGWRPRLASTLPEEIRGSCTVKFEDSEVIGWRGTILCEMPEAQARRMAQGANVMADQLMRAVDEDLRRVHEGGQRGFGAPVFTARHRTVEQGARPAPVD